MTKEKLYKDLMVIIWLLVAGLLGLSIIIVLTKCGQI